MSRLLSTEVGDPPDFRRRDKSSLLEYKVKSIQLYITDVSVSRLITDLSSVGQDCGSDAMFCLPKERV